MTPSSYHRPAVPWTSSTGCIDAVSHGRLGATTGLTASIRVDRPRGCLPPLGLRLHPARAPQILGDHVHGLRPRPAAPIGASCHIKCAECRDRGRRPHRAGRGRHRTYRTVQHPAACHGLQTAQPLCMDTACLQRRETTTSTQAFARLLDIENQLPGTLLRNG